MKSRGIILMIASALLLADPVTRSEAGAENSRHWSFVPVQRPATPSGPSAIDGFVSARLRAEGLTQNPPATGRELMRRAYFDLIGLPPSAEEVTAFEQDQSPGAFEKVVDRLLSSPQYGERWGRHWLDLVRFAQSNGYERDGEKLLAWRYRDYVINAFNKDKPYDRFVLEQIAGDELPDGTAESVVATAFQRLGVFDDEPDDRRMAEFDALDDVISTTGTAFLGLTLGCARCHDHKFDPIPQADYYSLLAFFRGVRHFESAAPNLDSPGFVPLAAPEEIKHWRAWKNSRIKSLEEKLATTGTEQKRKEIEGEVKKVREENPYEWTLAVRESGRECPATHILARGNAATPKGEVQPAFPRCLTTEVPRIPEPGVDAASSGRRRVLGEWIASARNPLTARVLVNRVWQHHFGEGLVKSTTDFGRAGSLPSHPELLDWLAAEFVDGGWSIKRLHKLIMMSGTYRQSSRADNERAWAVDPGNRLLWRQNLRRIEAEPLRDTVLAVSGLLNTRMAGRGFFPHLAGEVLAGQSRPGLDWDVSTTGEQSRRSVYAYIRRTMGVPLFEAFDYSNTTSPLAERPTTTVAPQALMLLNDAFMQEQASAFARRLEVEAGPERGAQIRRAYAIAFQRGPSLSEVQMAENFMDRSERGFCSVAGRQTFRLDVANALSTDYFAKLAASQFLEGPREGWSYYRGAWAPPYEGIRVAVREQAPFALSTAEAFENGTVEVDLQFANSTEFAGLIIRGRAENEVVHGYEFVFSPRSRQMRLLKHGSKTSVLGEASVPLPIGVLLPVKIVAQQGRLGVSVAGSLVLDVVDEAPIKEKGSVGVRTWGGPVHLENLRVVAEGEKGKELATRRGDSHRRALEAFCLLILNLNELIYID